jgi:hypothetical protein
MKMQSNVLGVRSFNGEVDGSNHNFTKVIVVMDMPERPNMRGQNVVEMNYGDHTKFDDFKDVKFPCAFELEVNLTTKGYELTSAKPITRNQG